MPHGGLNRFENTFFHDALFQNQNPQTKTAPFVVYLPILKRSWSDEIAKNCAESMSNVVKSPLYFFD